MQFRLIAIVASAALASASPLQARDATGTEGTISPTLGTAIGGALDPTRTPAPTKAAAAAAAAQYMTINIKNSHTLPISTSHAANAGGPTPVSGNVGPGVLNVGATGSFVVPPNWAGNVAFVESRYRITGDDSLLEANFVNSIVDVDISFVNGFSLPMTCSCSGGTVVAGCNKNIDALSRCPNNNGQGACVNPKRADTSATSAAPYFAPCQGAAYTFPKDDGANAYNVCQNGILNCCVGTACPPGPKQR